jgi:hypothetical protein
MVKRTKILIWITLIVAVALAAAFWVWKTQQSGQAASASPVPSPAENNVPVWGTPIPPSCANPRQRQISNRINHQHLLIFDGTMNKAFAPEQGIKLRDSLHAIIEKYKGYMNRPIFSDLTAEQQAELNRMLDENSGILGENQPVPITTPGSR